MVIGKYIRKCSSLAYKEIPFYLKLEKKTAITQRYSQFKYVSS